MSLVQGLLNYGLTEKEAKVYLLCLEYGTIQPAKVSSLSGINRSTCYDLLDSLVRKGILISTQHQGTKKYSAVDPSLLFEQLQQTCGSFEAILPTLIALGQKYATRPKIKVYEGLAGIKQLYLDTLTSPTDIYAFIGNQVASPEILTRFQEEYLGARRSKKIRAQVILCNSPANHLYHNDDSKQYRESRFLKDPTVSFECELACYGSHKTMIALYTSTDMYGVVIESEHLHKTLTGIFGYVRNGLGA